MGKLGNGEMRKCGNEKMWKLENVEMGVWVCLGF